MNFYLTFGQKSPARNGWIRIEACDMARARELAIREYGQAWSHLYTSEEFRSYPEGVGDFFPDGELGVLK